MKFRTDFFNYDDQYARYADVRSDHIYSSPKVVEQPKYSICIPTFRRSETLEQALICAVGQNFENYEVVIVENDPADNPEKVAIVKGFADCDIRYYRNEKNIGMFGNWNRCVELARGQYVVLLHDDDLIDFNFLFCVDKIQRSRDPDLILCDHRSIEYDGSLRIVRNTFLKRLWNVVRRFYDKRIVQVSIADYFYAYLSGTNGGVFRRSFALKAGGFCEEQYPTADYVFYSKLVSMGKSIYSFRQMASYRVGLNETIKENLHASFLENDYRFRYYLYERFFKGSFFKAVLLKPLVVYQAKILADVWRISRSELLKSAQLPLGWYSKNFLMQALVKVALIVQPVRRLLRSEGC